MATLHGDRYLAKLTSCFHKVCLLLMASHRLWAVDGYWKQLIGNRPMLSLQVADSSTQHRKVGLLLI